MIHALVYMERPWTFYAVHAKRLQLVFVDGGVVAAYSSRSWGDLKRQMVKGAFDISMETAYLNTDAVVQVVFE